MFLFKYLDRNRSIEGITKSIENSVIEECLEVKNTIFDKRVKLHNYWISL